MTRSRLHLVLLCTGALASIGCGPDGPKIVPVSGTLTRNGKPVPNLEVYFMPTQGRNSVGQADDQGRFTMGYTASQEGAVTGTHTVFVIHNPPMSGATQSAPPPDVKVIMDKYGSAEKSPIKIEITKAVKDLEIKLD